MPPESMGTAPHSDTNFSTLRLVSTLLVIGLWALPAWAVWQVMVNSKWQHGLNDLQLAVLAWYPLIAVLMLYFATVLYRRLPDGWIGLAVYFISTLGMAALHWWFSGIASLSLLLLEWAAFSLTLFVFGFSLELFRRILQMAIKGHYWLVVLGGLANIGLFVVPGVLITISLYTVLFQQGLFSGNVLNQIPYWIGLAIAVFHDWRSFRVI